jgi:hypothetical protein
MNRKKKYGSRFKKTVRGSVQYGWRLVGEGERDEAYERIRRFPVYSNPLLRLNFFTLNSDCGGAGGVSGGGSNVIVSPLYGSNS